jgi:hypothetical protein
MEEEVIRTPDYETHSSSGGYNNYVLNVINVMICQMNVKMYMMMVGILQGR